MGEVKKGAVKGCINFDKDYHPEFYGWLWEKDDGVWISFIKAREEGKGHFSNLLKELMRKYNWIKIPTPSNKMLEIAKRKGFQFTNEFQTDILEECEVMLWKK